MLPIIIHESDPYISRVKQKYPDTKNKRMKKAYRHSMEAYKGGYSKFEPFIPRIKYAYLEHAMRRCNFYGKELSKQLAEFKGE